MQDKRSVPFLKKTLEDTSEHEMVRHEAAEALGSIATEECTEVLQRWVDYSDDFNVQIFHRIGWCSNSGIAAIAVIDFLSGLYGFNPFSDSSSRVLTIYGEL